MTARSMTFRVMDGAAGPLAYDSNWNRLGEQLAIAHSRAKEDFTKLSTSAAISHGVAKPSLTLVYDSATNKPSTQFPSDMNAPPTIVYCRPKVNPEAGGVHANGDSQWETYLQQENQHAETTEAPQRSSPIVRPDQPSKCVRCDQTVYPKEAVEPKSGVIYHEWCFKCKDCGLKLNLKSYCLNHKHPDDLEVYCKTHTPQLNVARIDHTAKGIDHQHVPKLTSFNNQIRGPEAGKAVRFDATALSIQSALNAPKATDRKINPNPPPTDVVKSDTIGLRYL